MFLSSALGQKVVRFVGLEGDIVEYTLANISCIPLSSGRASLLLWLWLTFDGYTRAGQVYVSVQARNAEMLMQSIAINVSSTL